MGNERPLPRAGEFYRHKSGKLYQMITLAYHSETMEPLVIYQALYDEFKTYARPLSMFMEEVDGVKRFQKVRLKKEEKATPKVESVKEPIAEEPKKKAQTQDVLIEFLDAKDMKEKYDILRQKEDLISEVALDSIGLSLDFVLNSNNREGKIQEIKEFLSTKMKYEADRR